MRIGVMPIWWAICYLWYVRASKEIAPMHPDVIKVNLGRLKYARLLGVAEYRRDCPPPR